MTRSGRSGFTLIEVLVALAVIVILAATIAPSVVASLDRARIDAAEKALAGIAQGISEFYMDVSEMPRGLNQLVTPLVNGDTDLCGDAYTGGQRNQWAGPYLNRAVPAAGFPVAIGTVGQAFVGAPAPPGDPTLLHLSVTGVLVEDAVALDARLDGDGDQTTGVIRWSVAVNGFVTMLWTIPVASC